MLMFGIVISHMILYFHIENMPIFLFLLCHFVVDQATFYFHIIHFLENINAYDLGFEL